MLILMCTFMYIYKCKVYLGLVLMSSSTIAKIISSSSELLQSSIFTCLLIDLPESEPKVETIGQCVGHNSHHGLQAVRDITVN